MVQIVAVTTVGAGEARVVVEGDNRREITEGPARQQAINAAQSQLGRCGFDKWDNFRAVTPDGKEVFDEAALMAPMPAGTRYRYDAVIRGTL